MKIISRYIILFLGITGAYLPGIKAQQQRQLPEFTGIDAGEAFHLQLFQADRHAAYIDENDESVVRTEVKNGVLHISSKEKTINDPVKVKVYFRDLSSLSLSGAARATARDTLTLTQFDIGVSGATKADLLIRASLVKAEASGASDVTMTGKSDTIYVEATGASKLDAAELVSQFANVEATGVSHVKINAQSSVSVSATGMSHVSFSGNPATKNIALGGMAKANGKDKGEEYDAKIDEGGANDKDTTRVRIGRKKFIIIDEKDDVAHKDKDKKSSEKRQRRMKPVWGIIDFGVNSFVTPSMGFTFDNKYKFLNTKMGDSWFFSFNLPEADGHIIRNKLAITTGLGFQWNSFSFEGNDFLTPHDSLLSSTTSPFNLSTNQLSTFDITVPVFLKFAPGTKRRARAGFHMAAGTIFHFVASKEVTTETSANGYKQTMELEDHFNINPFRVDATVRFGYGPIKLFANYALTPYFNRSKAPDIRTFAAGITLFGW